MHLVTASASMTSLRLYESGTTDGLDTRRMDSTLAMPTMEFSPAAAVVAAEKAAVAEPTGNVTAAVKENVDAVNTGTRR